MLLLEAVALIERETVDLNTQISECHGGFAVLADWSE